MNIGLIDVDGHNFPIAWDNYEFKTYEKLKEIRPFLKFSYRKLANCTYFTSKEITQKALDKFKDRIRVLYIDTEKDN